MRRVAKFQASIPVVCIGNLTAGGTGKTPMTAWMCRQLAALGHRPAVLMRGYGGAVAGPHKVVPVRDGAERVGDEALLSARVADVFVSRDRVAGVAAIEAAGSYSIVVMDDGFQNPTVAKTVSIVMVDARRGIGNGWVIPAGPLRAPLAAQLALADAIVLTGARSLTELDAARIAQRLRASGFDRLLVPASVEPTGDPSWLRGQRVMAFAGIGAPQRFAATLSALGADIVDFVAFPDHHAYVDSDARRLIDRAAAACALLVTTEKDQVRLSGSAALDECGRRSRALGIRLAIDALDAVRLHALLARAGVVPARR
jgi:tetraacyldisaccharide 4'-kinase